MVIMINSVSSSGFECLSYCVSISGKVLFLEGDQLYAYVALDAY